MEYFRAGAQIDADNNANSKQVRGGASITYDYTNGSVVFTNSYSLLEREFLSNTFASKNKSRFYSYDFYNKYSFNNKIFTVVGINGSNNDYEGFSAGARGQEFFRTIDDDTADFDIIDPYANIVYASGFGLNLNLGARLNIHSEYGTNIVYSINPSYTYKFGENYIKGLASYSTAYITPSLFQLFAEGFGNRKLDPEENTTIEGGIEFSFVKKLRVSAVYFVRNEENFVNFVDTGNFVFQYQNIKEDFSTSGLEFEINSRVLDDKLSLAANFTYTNVDEDLAQIRIPEIKINATIGYQITDKTFSSLSYQFNDNREDSFFNNTTFESESKTLDSYSLLDFYVSHQLMKNLKFFGALNNIANDDYQEIFGFSTRGRNARIGFNLEF